MVNDPFSSFLGKPIFPKSDEFPENFRTALDPLPPAPFSEKNVAIFFQTGPNRTKFATKFFRSEMTPPFFWRFSGKSWPKLAFLKQKKTQRNFLDRKWPPPLFRKFSGNSSLFVNLGFPKFCVHETNCASMVWRGTTMMTVEPILGGIIKFSVKAKQSLPAKTSQSFNFWLSTFGHEEA